MNNDRAQYFRGLLNAYNFATIGPMYPDFSIVDYVKTRESVVEVDLLTCIDKCKEAGIEYDANLFQDESYELTYWVMLGKDFEKIAGKYHDLDIASKEILDFVSNFVRDYQDVQHIKELRHHGMYY